MAVIGGGQNSEHEVSLASAAAVADALDPAAYDVVRLTIDPEGGWRDGERDRSGWPARCERAAHLRGRGPGAARPAR